MPRSPAWWSQHCRPIVAILDEHLAGPSQQRGNSNGTLVVYGAMSGIGDQVAGMLGGLALALGAGRRFEIGEEASSLISSWFFDSSYDLEYSGDQRWLDGRLDDALYGLFARWRNCSVQCSACCRRSKVVERPLVDETRMAYTYGYGAAHHRFRFTEPVEFISLGNSGINYFRGVFTGMLQRRFGGLPFKEEYFSCAVRHLLRPTALAIKARDGLRPAFWPPRLESAPPNATARLSARLSRRPPNATRVAIHVRAHAVLINRRFNQTRASYGGHVDPDRTMGCIDSAAGSVDSSVPGAKPGGGRATAADGLLSLYNEYWLVARSAEAAHMPAPAPSPGDASIWLLATDSTELKSAASQAWPQGRCGVTSVRPSHTRCHLHTSGSSWLIERRLESRLSYVPPHHNRRACADRTRADHGPSIARAATSPSQTSPHTLPSSSRTRGLISFAHLFHLTPSTYSNLFPMFTPSIPFERSDRRDPADGGGRRAGPWLVRLRRGG